MTPLTDITRALESSAFAAAINSSTIMLGGLSGLHLLGYTLVVGAAVVSNFRLMGLLFAERPAHEIARPAARAMMVGLALSIATGSLLFAPRATRAAANWIFETKMALLAAAVIVQVIVSRTVSRTDPPSPVRDRLAGAVSLALWLGVALAACAFILIE